MVLFDPYGFRHQVNVFRDTVVGAEVTEHRCICSYFMDWVTQNVYYLHTWEVSPDCPTANDTECQVENSMEVNDLEGVSTKLETYRINNIHL